MEILNMKYTAIFLGILVLPLLFSNSAYAQEAILCQMGYPGWNTMADGGVYIASDKYKVLKSIDSEGNYSSKDKTADDLKPVVLFQTAHIGEDGWCLYAGNSYQSVSDGYNIGGTRFVDELGRVDLAIIYNEEDVRKDPYFDDHKHLTKKQSYGVRIQLNEVLESRFGIYYRFQKLDVKRDEIKEKHPELGRDGYRHFFSGRYVFQLGIAKFLTSTLNYVVEDLKGKNESLKGIGPSVFYRQQTGNLFLYSSLSLLHLTYEGEHVLFKEKQKSWYMGGNIFASYTGLFDNPRLYVTGGIDLSGIDSNINYFDSESASVYISAGYYF